MRMILPALAVGAAVLNISPAAAGAALSSAGDASSVPVLSGHLLRNGVPVDGSFQVVAWPASTASMHRGQVIANPVVAEGTITGGQFTPRVDPAQVGAEVRRDDGSVDLEVIVTDGAHETNWATTVDLGSGRAGLASGTARGEVQDDVSIDLGTGSVRSAALDASVAGQGRSSEPRAMAAPGTDASTEADSLHEVTVHPRSARWGSNTSRRAQGALAVPRETCLTTFNKYVNYVPETFATVYAWSGAKVKVDEQEGATHTLGIATSSDAKVWSGGGTSGLTMDAGNTVSGVVDAYVRNRVNYAQYYNPCSGWTMRPSSLAAPMPASDMTYAKHYDYPNTCTSYTNGETPWKQHVKNSGYSWGVDVGPINLYAQGGWNSGTKMTYVITAPTWICGSTNQGWAASPNSSARKR